MDGPDKAPQPAPKRPRSMDVDDDTIGANKHRKTSPIRPPDSEPPLPTCCPDEELAYRMDHPKQGMFILINNKKFGKSTKMNHRKGSDIDANDLRGLFNNLGFEVEQDDNRTIAQMEKIVKKASRRDHSQYDMFALAILSHGDQGVVYGTDGPVELDQLLAPLKGDRCKSLIGKPKLIIIQACRGDKIDKGADRRDSWPSLNKLLKSFTRDGDEQEAYRIPIEADFLYAYSTCPGYYSWRNKDKGSWYIQSLCEVLRKHGQTHEMTWILTHTNRLVAYNYESDTGQVFKDKSKQMPCFVSQLTKELYLTPKPK